MRILTRPERLLLEAMIRRATEHGERAPADVDRSRWLAMINDLSVHRTCDCGTCPTIDFAYKNAPVNSPEINSRIVLEASAPDAIILLFIDDDIPSCLEVAPLGDEPVTLPSPDGIVFH